MGNLNPIILCVSWTYSRCYIYVACCPLMDCSASRHRVSFFAQFKRSPFGVSIITMNRSSCVGSSNAPVALSILKMCQKQHVFCIKVQVPSDNANNSVWLLTRGSFMKAIVQELDREERIHTCMRLLLCIHNVAVMFCHHRWSIFLFRREWSPSCVLSWGRRHWRTFPCSQKN